MVLSSVYKVQNYAQSCITLARVAMFPVNPFWWKCFLFVNNIEPNHLSLPKFTWAQKTLQEHCILATKYKPIDKN